MSDFDDFDAEREATIAKNKEILAQLDLTIDIPLKRKASAKQTAKPIQPAKRKREKEFAAPVRQSARLRRAVREDLNESPSKKKRRVQEEEEERKREEEARLAEEERARIAKRPRHHDLDLKDVTEVLEPDEFPALRSTLDTVVQTPYPQRVSSQEAFVFDNDAKDKAAVADLRDKLGRLKIVARAKVTQDRVYSATYHPDPTKDLIFLGDKHGQLGIWDARAPKDETSDDEYIPREDAEGGKYWRLQVHWPATSKSSISSMKFDPVDSHTVFTSAYDCTIRSLDFTSGVSREVYSSEDILISSIDLTPTGHEMWISDGNGGITHLDLREDKSKAKWYQLSDQKVGSVSINPINTQYLVTASNNRALKIWDIRRLADMTADASPNSQDFDHETVQEFVSSKEGKNLMRAEWRHGKSVSSAYWDPRGRSIVSTSYDDTIRLWDVDSNVLGRDAPFPSSRPFSQIKHNCQVGKWVTVLKAQWSQNTDYYPHFTIGNMDRSLNIFSCKGDLIAKLSDPKRISAVQAVTCSHPNILERVASGNASGRCVLWAPPEE